MNYGSVRSESVELDDADEDADDNEREEASPSSYPLWKQLLIGAFVALPLLCLIVVACRYPQWQPGAAVSDEDIFVKPRHSTYFTAQVPPENLVSYSQTDRGHTSPCEDFYQHACAEFLEQPLPLETTEWEYAFDGVKARIAPSMHDALQGDSGQAGQLFRSCEAAGADKRGAAPLAPFLEMVDSMKTNASFAYTVAALHAINSKAFFDWEVRPDADSSNEMIYLSQGGLTLSEPSDYAVDSNQVLILRTYISRIMVLTGVASADADVAASAVIDVETKLAKMHVSPTEEKTSKSLPPLTVEQVIAGMGGSFDWRIFFETIGLLHDQLDANMTRTPVVQDMSLHNVSSADPPAVRVLDVLFFRRLVDFVAARPMADLRWYLRWRVLDSLVGHLGEPFQAESHKFRAALWGVKDDPPRWRNCEETLNAYTPLAMGKLYKTVIQNEKETEALAALLLQSLRDAFDALLKSCEWLSEGSRALARQKLRAMVFNIGGPTEWPELPFNITEDWFQNAILIARYQVAKQVARVGKPLRRTEWASSVGPMTVNAYYSVQQNALFVPVALLQPPFVHARTEPGAAAGAADFGSLGGLLGHEMMHGFDMTGSHFGSAGQIGEIWDQNTTLEFERRTQCVASYYSTYLVGGQQVDGNNTLDEDLADIGGLQVAYSAWQNLAARTESSVAKGSAFVDKSVLRTETQNFFLGWAQTWCTISNKKVESLNIRTDPHAPARVRVNAALARFRPFADAYDCPVGAEMRPPVQPCSLWSENATAHSSKDTM